MTGPGGWLGDPEGLFPAGPKPFSVRGEAAGWLQVRARTSLISLSLLPAAPLWDKTSCELPAASDAERGGVESLGSPLQVPEAALAALPGAGGVRGAARAISPASHASGARGGDGSEAQGHPRSPPEANKNNAYAEKLSSALARGCIARDNLGLFGADGLELRGIGLAARQEGPGVFCGGFVCATLCAALSWRSAGETSGCEQAARFGGSQKHLLHLLELERASKHGWGVGVSVRRMESLCAPQNLVCSAQRGHAGSWCRAPALQRGGRRGQEPSDLEGFGLETTQGG